jgi:vitamin B12 transporter
MMRKWAILFGFLICFLGVSAQKDTIISGKIKEFVVLAEPIPIQIFAIQPIQKMNKEEIKQFSSYQISEVIKHFAGTVVKDYGGIGGMKTVSVRGLGSQHTGVLFNGIPLTDSQTGQIDIGKISLDFLESISLSNGSSNNLFTSAREQSFGAVLNIISENPVFQNDSKFTLQSSFSAGSFGFLNGSLKISNRLFTQSLKNWNCISSITGHYSSLIGDYPFTQFFGGSNDSTSKEIRHNSDLQSIQTEGSLLLSHKTRKEIFRIHLFYYHSERGLPGAAIYYNIESDQRLWDDNLFLQTKYFRFFTKKFSYANLIKINQSYMRYLDPSYLNEEGKLDNTYVQNEWYISNILNYNLTLFHFSLAHDLFYNNLFSNSSNYIAPSRLTSLTSFSSKFNFKWLKVDLNLLHTRAYNQAKSGEAAPDYNKLSPTAGISIKPFSKKEFYIRAFYKNIFRLPTFNDLYYREVGNLNLKPENTYQYSIGLTNYSISKDKKYSVSTTLDGYFNIIHDKIVAIPAKNLFIWTMINYGTVYASGIDFTIQGDYKMTKKIQLSLIGSYSFQKAIDMTDPTSKTYRNQLPYTPLHSGSIGCGIHTSWIDLNYNAIISDYRYVLGQNISQNLISGYIDHTISIGKEFTFKNRTQTHLYRIGIKGEVNNFTNQQYQIIKNYPMPGRNFRIKIQFQL